MKGTFRQHPTIDDVIDAMYPVGSVYMSFSDAMPAALTTGRTWVPVVGGYILKTVAPVDGGGTAGNAGVYAGATATGGTALNINQIPTHNHPVYFKSNTVASGSGTWHLAVPSDNSGNTTTGNAGGVNGVAQEHTHTPGMPANVAVHMWQRTA